MAKQRTGNQRSALSRAWWIAMAGLLLCVIVLYVVKTIGVNAAQQKPAAAGLSAEERMTQAKALLAEGGISPATLVTAGDAGTQKMLLSFEGTPGPGVLDKLLEMLSQYDLKATFFLSAMGAGEDASAARRILAEGHTLGCYGFAGDKHMESLSQEALISDLCRANTAFSNLTGKETNLLKCNATTYTPAFLKTAAACGFSTVYDTPNMVSWQSFVSYEAVGTYIDKKERGSIISIKLSEALDPADIRTTPTPAPTPSITPAVTPETAAAITPAAPVMTPEPEPTVTTPPMDLSAYSVDERVLMTAEWFMKALENTKALPETETLRKENNGRLAKAMVTVYTTERAVAYLFYGLGNDAELDYLLQVLDEIHATGTFFVTLEEAQTCEAQIKSILSHGHDLGVAMRPAKSADFYTACTEILRCQQELKTRYGYDGADVVKQPYGAIPDALREAVSATGCRLITHEVTAVQAANREAESAEAVMENLLGEQTISFKRGELIYFAMNYYSKNDRVLGDLARLLQERINVYSVCSVNEMLTHEEFLYTYPVPEDAVLPEVKDAIYKGHIGDMRDADFFKLLRTRYVGNPVTNGSANLPGFTRQEIRQLNVNGTIKNSDNAVFFTFDDWGSDRTLIALLDVLQKHNAKVTFYIRTNNIPNNPNLLRAIALAGHDIASHTHSHYPMASDYNADGIYEQLEEHELEEYQQDLITSYEQLQSIVGDVAVDGKPALQLSFRPPTLAMSKNGSRAILDAGFSYIVMGDLSTHDYEANSAEDLYRSLKDNVSSGSVVVMHMSDTAKYTAEALDRFLTDNEKKPESQRFVLRRISDYLDGTYETGR